MRRQVFGCVLASLAVSVSGCQSWSQVSQGIPSGSRVPPPGTGTYQVPSSYYNNGAGAKTGAVSTSAQPAGSNTTAARTAAQPLPSTGSTAGSAGGAPTAATTANWQIPTVDQVRSSVNSTAGAVFDDVNNRANQVVQAGTARAASAVEKYTDPAPSLRPVPAQATNQAAGPSMTQQPSNSSQASLAAPTSPAASSRPSSAATSRTLSDRTTAQEDPQLDWQAPE